MTDPNGNSTTRFIDNLGRRMALTNPLGQRTRYDYDALDRLAAITDALGGLTQFGYDPNGNLLSVTDARGNATTYAYNAMDRLAARADPLGRPESYGYDNNGNLASFTDRKSQMTSSTHDALDRLTQRTYADGSTTTYTWDAGNRLTQLMDSVSGTITRTYDGLDRLMQETTSQGTVSYTYDAACRRTTMMVAGQPTVTYIYDDASRLTRITQGASTVSFTYDASNRRVSLTLPNGVITDYAYDASSRLTGLTYRRDATTLGTLTYAYDAARNRTVIGGTWARTGLPQAVPSATYDAANRQLTFGSQTLNYDFNGNLMSDDVVTYSWDARNRLVNLNGTNIANFQYDPLGRRVRRTINGVTSDFLYDGLNPVQELATGTTVNFLTGLGIDTFFSRTDATGTRTFLADMLGSTMALSDDAGTVQTEYTYAPFGTVTSSGSLNDNTFLYTAREWDFTSLHYYRARYYDSTRQRFISEDPILAPMPATSPFNLSSRSVWPLRQILRSFPTSATQVLDAYVYASNNPLRSTDPLGLISGRARCFARCALVCYSGCAIFVGEIWQLAVACLAGCTLGCDLFCLEHPDPEPDSPVPQPTPPGGGPSGPPGTPIPSGGDGSPGPGEPSCLGGRKTCG